MTDLAEHLSDLEWDRIAAEVDRLAYNLIAEAIVNHAGQAAPVLSGLINALIRLMKAIKPDTTPEEVRKVLHDTIDRLMKLQFPTRH